jgi:hypothetical protein
VHDALQPARDRRRHVYHLRLHARADSPDAAAFFLEAGPCRIPQPRLEGRGDTESRGACERRWPTQSGAHTLRSTPEGRQVRRSACARVTVRRSRMIEHLLLRHAQVQRASWVFLFCYIAAWSLPRREPAAGPSRVSNRASARLAPIAAAGERLVSAARPAPRATPAVNVPLISGPKSSRASWGNRELPDLVPLASWAASAGFDPTRCCCRSGTCPTAKTSPLCGVCPRMSIDPGLHTRPDDGLMTVTRVGRYRTGLFAQRHTEARAAATKPPGRVRYASWRAGQCARRSSNGVRGVFVAEEWSQ